MKVVATEDQFHKEIHRVRGKHPLFGFDESQSREASDYVIKRWKLQFAPPYVVVPQDYPDHNKIMVSICKKAGGHIAEHADITIDHFLTHAIPPFIGEDDWDE